MNTDKTLFPIKAAINTLPLRRPASPNRNQHANRIIVFHQYRKCGLQSNQTNQTINWWGTAPPVDWHHAMVGALHFKQPQRDKRELVTANRGIRFAGQARKTTIVYYSSLRWGAHQNRKRGGRGRWLKNYAGIAWRNVRVFACFSRCMPRRDVHIDAVEGERGKKRTQTDIYAISCVHHWRLRTQGRHTFSSTSKHNFQSMWMRARVPDRDGGRRPPR